MPAGKHQFWSLWGHRLPKWYLWMCCSLYTWESAEQGDAPARLFLTEEMFSVGVPKALCHQAISLPRRKLLQLRIQILVLIYWINRALFVLANSVTPFAASTFFFLSFISTNKFLVSLRQGVDAGRWSPAQGRKLLWIFTAACGVNRLWLSW